MAGKPVLYAFWHGRQMVLFKFNPEKHLAVLTSLSRDGEMQARVCRKFGLEVVRGSSSRGGLQGLVKLRKRIRAGISVGMAVDGPRGPVYKAKIGLVLLSSQTQAPIVPVSAGLRRKVVPSRAWDCFQIPLPFSSATVAFGEPMLVPPRLSPEELGKVADDLTTRLRTLTQEVDSRQKSG